MIDLKEESIVLLQWRPTWAIQAFLRFEGIPYTVQNIAYPANALGVFPQLRDGNYVLSGDDNVMLYVLKHLNEKNGSGDDEEGNNTQTGVVVPESLLTLLFEELPHLLYRAEVLDHPDARKRLANSFKAAVKASPSWLFGLFLAGRNDLKTSDNRKHTESEVSQDANQLYDKLLELLQDNSLQPHVLSLVKSCLFGHVAEALLLPCLNQSLLIQGQGQLIEHFLSTYETCFVKGLKHDMRNSADDANGCNQLGNLPTALSVARWGIRLEEDSVVQYSLRQPNTGPSWMNVFLVALPVFSLSFLLHRHHHS